MSDLQSSLLKELECPVCLDFMTPPIKLCESGHSICESCIKKLSVCPLCLKLITTTRNIALESLSEKTAAPCINHIYGCTALLTIRQRKSHEGQCTFKPVPCLSCKWSGKPEDLKNHWINKGRQVQDLFNNANGAEYKLDLKQLAETDSFTCTAFNLAEWLNQLLWIKAKVENKKIYLVVQLASTPEKNTTFGYDVRISNPAKPVPVLVFANSCQNASTKPNSFQRSLILDFHNEVVQSLLDSNKCLYYQVAISSSRGC